METSPALSREAREAFQLAALRRVEPDD